MKIILHKNKLIKLIKNEKNLGFVPTMGGIHNGHISLIKKSINICEKTLVSIFVNKPQFNKRADFIKYPRNHYRDTQILRRHKVDFLYIPKHKEIYPLGQNKKIKINNFSRKLCGKYRKGHFKAVVDVVNRFIKIIKPKKIFLGEKDMQQLKIIEDFVRNNNYNIKVIPCKTIREKNGLALSSRNFLLSADEKNMASKIYKLIKNNKSNIIKNKKFLKKIKKNIYNFGLKKIDYIELIDINKILKPFKKEKKFRIFIAYYLRSTRLIDNI